ncbi:MAG: lytic transglycosylase domain-containing protein, partial [Sphingobium sp.]
MSTMGKAPRIARPLGALALTLGITCTVADAQNPTQLMPPGMVQPVPGTVQPIPGSQNPAMVQDWRTASGQIIAASTADQGIDGTIAEWRRLQQSDTLGFGAYAGFITANPGWPGEDRMRRLAETSVDPSYNAQQAVAFFTRFPPTTPTGEARYALALAAAGGRGDAAAHARAAWVGGPLNVNDEQRLLALFSSSLTPDDHLRRADALLWAGDIAGAQRIAPYVPATRRAVVDARIAMQSRWPDAAQRMAAADPVGVTDGGYLADKSRWVTNANDWVASRAILADRQYLSQPVAAPEKWYETLLAAARSAGNDGNWTMAYQIASKIDDAFPAGTDISTKAIGVRDDYTSLAWLAGTTALNRLNRPADAVGMFTRYAGGAKSPQTISKGYYWAGRAATAAGRTGEAQDHFRRAAAYPDQYYGQLALERIGQPIPLPAAAEAPVQPSEAMRQAFDNRSVVRAAKRLGLTGNWQDQSKMLRAIASNAGSDADHALVGDLSRSLSRPDLGVMAGRKALLSGLSAYTNSSFPRVPVPEQHR